ncbi:hypothetical protein CBR_g32503 [Chara braunii]|uniref:Methyltransferase FkbM domain-containing protein n=1 Tax=Chara braunii TaxID=69332 RepID=A0A388LGS0_CHABU|nr:hypothetical protein CBR_g32503 [Chara braunii]|eukprot:GBG81514.1 hypothetical protein CBR_g32503 [Chara braunii]
MAARLLKSHIGAVLKWSLPVRGYILGSNAGHPWLLVHLLNRVCNSCTLVSPARLVECYLWFLPAILGDDGFGNEYFWSLIPAKSFLNCVPFIGEGSRDSKAHCGTWQADIYFQEGVELQANDIIVNAGANIGMFELRLQQHFEATADDIQPQVIAIEPLPPNFEVLCRNLELHGLKHVRAIQVGLGAGGNGLQLAEGSTNSATFTYYPEMPGNSTFKPLEKKALQSAYMVPKFFRNPQLFKCQLKTLSEIICEEALERINLLKIDVEGMELEVLNGIDASHWPRISQ